MNYQSICRGLYKKASSEQLKKLASLIGMRKRAEAVVDPDIPAITKALVRGGALGGTLPGAYASRHLGLASWQPKYMPSAKEIEKPLSPAQQTKNKIRSLVGTLYRPFYPAVRSIGPVIQKGVQNAVKQSRIPSLAK